MTTAVAGSCRVSRCEQAVPLALAGESLCLDHFLDHAFVQADAAYEQCCRGADVDPEMLEWLLANAHVTLKALSQSGAEHDINYQTRILELLLCVANLNEYVAHHAIRPAPPV